MKSSYIYRTRFYNRPRDLSLTTEDIVGARPRVGVFVSNRHTNPLDPQYSLPAFKTIPTPGEHPLVGSIPTNFISDIPGTAPIKLHRSLSGDFDRFSNLDIRNSRPKQLIRQSKKSGSFDPLDVSDINHRVDFPLPRPRNTNPLEPVYVVPEWNGVLSPTNSSMTIGPIPDSKPSKLIPETRHEKLPPIEKNSPQRYVGIVPHSSLQKEPVITRAIPTGSRASTLKKGVVSRRQTHPLSPDYVLLDGRKDALATVLTH